MGELVRLVLNELSVAEPAPTRGEGRARMAALNETITHVFAWCPQIEQIVMVSESFCGMSLAEGYTLYDWLYDDASEEVDQDVRLVFVGLLTAGPYVDDALLECLAKEGRCDVNCFEQRVFGIGLALFRNYPVLSAPLPPWQRDELPVTERRPDGDVSGAVHNFFGLASVDRQLSWLAERLLQTSDNKISIKPKYDHAWHHDRSSIKFRGDSATDIPPDAEEAYRRAIMEDGEFRTWWSKGRDGHIYRYQASLIGGVYRAHWNGSTDAEASGDRVLREHEIPASVRRHFR